MASDSNPDVSTHRALNGIAKGDLHKATGTAPDKTIPDSKLEAAKGSDNPHLSTMANMYSPKATPVSMPKPAPDTTAKPTVKPVNLGQDQTRTSVTLQESPADINNAMKSGGGKIDMD